MSEFLSTEAMNASREVFNRLKGSINSRIKGKDDVIDNILICLAAGGHALIEDLPGVGKPLWPIVSLERCTRTSSEFSSRVICFPLTLPVFLSMTNVSDLSCSKRGRSFQISFWRTK